MLFNLIFLVFFPIFFSKLHIFEGFFQSIDVEKNITLDHYTGKWYQAATTRLFGTGINYTSVTAEYQCIGNCKDNNISVLNQCIDPKGNYNDISGYSYVDNMSESAKRKLKFYSLPFI
jgi:lipocalin